MSAEDCTHATHVLSRPGAASNSERPQALQSIGADRDVAVQPGHLRHARFAGQNARPHLRHSRREIMNDRSRITWHVSQRWCLELTGSNGAEHTTHARVT